MDYEKKQRLIALCNRMKEYGYTDGVEELESIFPELAESEDEKIIEGFYTLIHGIRRDGGLTLNKVPLDKCEAWLEKQKEQKPEFYPGDVIKCTSTGSLWVRCKGGDNRRSDGHTACIGGGYELASEEEAVQFFQELNENGYQWDCIKGEPMKKEQKPAEGDMKICGDDRFEVIGRAKQDLLDKTNIADSLLELAVLNNFLFRCWQMGWLKKYETDKDNPD